MPRAGLPLIDPYAVSGVDTDLADESVAGLLVELQKINPGRPTQTVVGPGHYAALVRISPDSAIAMCTDGVGTKAIVASEMHRFDSIGIDCVAMNANDVVCVGAEPLALVDYIAVQSADKQMLQEIGQGLRAGAERAGLEIPGGEVAQLPEMIQGHPDHGFDLVGTCFGTVSLSQVVSGSSIVPGDSVIGLPSSGIHANGLTLASKILKARDILLDATCAELGKPAGEELLTPTEIYVRAVEDLVASVTDSVHGLAHITSDGFLNLLRLNPEVGYQISEPLEPQPIFPFLADLSIGTEMRLQDKDLYEIFNMGTGFCCIVSSEEVDTALASLTKSYPTAREIGYVTDEAGSVRLPGLVGDRAGFQPA